MCLCKPIRRPLADFGPFGAPRSRTIGGVGLGNAGARPNGRGPLFPLGLGDDRGDLRLGRGGFGTAAGLMQHPRQLP